MNPTVRLCSMPPGPIDRIATVNLDNATAVQRMCALPKCPPLYIDCSDLVCQRTLGVSHVVSQLLILHRAGARIWLRNVNPSLRHCLHLLQLESLFHLAVSS
jgi:anti-anti-sigma regulatory factor